MVKYSNMKICNVAFIALMIATLSGCYTIGVASSPDFSNCTLAAEKGKTPTSHMLVKNEGWFLFDRIPIVCGNTDTESIFPWTFFNDEVSMAYVQKAIVRRAEIRGERIVQMNVINHDATLMSLPSTQGLSVPYLICHHETQISAVYVKDAPPAASAATSGVKREKSVNLETLSKEARE